jgi:hypothetical protein
MPQTKPTSEQVTFLAAGSGATQRTALDKLRDVVSVKDFGAVGNGTTDDTTAFNNAWTASNPNPVYVPGGSYAITGTVTGSFVSFGSVTIVGGTVNSISQYAGNATVTGDLAVNGGDITTTSATATLVNATATTVNIGGAATTVALGASAGTVSVGNLSMNAGYGSIAPVYGCRAWANINGTTNNNVAATYSQSGTTVTVTSNNHGHLAGHYIYNVISTGTAVTGGYFITSVTTNTFTYTASTSLTTSGNCSLTRATIRASGNVHSVYFPATGSYVVNFLTAMPDANYVLTGASGGQSATSNGSVYLYDQYLTPPGRTTLYMPIYTPNTIGSGASCPNIDIAIFR